MEDQVFSRIKDKQKNDSSSKLRKFFSGENFPEDFQKWSKSEQKKWLRKEVQLELPSLPDYILSLVIGTLFDGDSGRPSDEKPDWLDLEKFKRGQKFARDNAFSIAFSQLMSLFTTLSFDSGLKAIILTDKSSTPYKAFKRYLSTAICLRNWYTEDPWSKGTVAYNGIQAVRKIHAAIRKKLVETKNEDIDELTKIKNPYCPTRDIILKDLQSIYSANALDQCPYLMFKKPDFVSIRPKATNQAEMAFAQFAFMGFIVVYPKSFGVHNASEEDLEAFCHTWRGIGYLLGMDEEYNICRGSLKDIRQRCKDLVEFWIKPNLSEITPEYEHMMRCMVEGIQYYIPLVCFKSSFLSLMDLLNLHTPRFYASTTYRCWMTYHIMKIVFKYVTRVPGMRTFFNKKFNSFIDNAINITSEEHEVLKRRSKETLENNAVIC